MDPSSDTLFAAIQKQERSALPWLLANLGVIVLCLVGWAVAGTFDAWTLAVAMAIVGCLAIVMWLPFSAAMAGAAGRLRHARSKATIEGRDVSELELCLDARRSYQRWLGSWLLADAVPTTLLGFALMADGDTAFLGLVAFGLTAFALAGGIWGHVAANRTTELVQASTAAHA